MSLGQKERGRRKCQSQRGKEGGSRRKEERVDERKGEGVCVDGERAVHACAVHGSGWGRGEGERD